jgi:hypothetical protein
MNLQQAEMAVFNKATTESISEGKGMIYRLPLRLGNMIKRRVKVTEYDILCNSKYIPADQ